MGRDAAAGPVGVAREAEVCGKLHWLFFHGAGQQATRERCGHAAAGVSGGGSPART